MTREEQRGFQELKRTLEKTCKEVGKRRGWKTIAGQQYQVRDGMLYVLVVSFTVFDGGQMLKANLRCKPLALDEMYWDAFHMAEEAASQPFSFHFRGVFAAPCLLLPVWKEPLSSPEKLGAVAEAVFAQAEVLAEENAFPRLASYRKRLEEDPRCRTLEIVQCLLCEKKYAQAMEVIEEGIARGENGGFLRMSGRQGVLQDARDYCAARL